MTASLAESLADNADDLDQLLADLTDPEIDALLRDWGFWARPEQRAPAGQWTLWARIAGRGEGKTRSGAEFVLDRAEQFHAGAAGAWHRVALVGRTAADCRDTMIEGEALALDTPVATPEGFTPIGDLRPGDVVLGGDGAPCLVTDAYSVLYDRPCYEVQISGATVTADAAHRWETWTHPARAARYRARTKYGPDVVTTAEMLATLTLPSGQRNHAIATTTVPDLGVSALPIDPYTLGYWLGDGTSKSGELTIHTADQPWVRRRVDAAGYHTTDRAHPYCVGVRGLRRPLRLAGLLRNKHVPAVYLRATVAERLALLQGLIDSDGHVTKRGQVEFSNRNQRLLSDVVALVSSLGIRCGVSGNRVQFSTGLPVASLPRKAERIRAPREEDRWRYVKAITPTVSVPVRCIAVDSPDRTFLITEHHVRTHNSGLAACCERRGYVGIYQPSKRRFVIPELATTCTTYSAAEPDSLRGPQEHTAWADEPAAWVHKVDPQGNTAWTNLMFGLRLDPPVGCAMVPQVIATTTPKPIPLVVDWFVRAGLIPDPATKETRRPDPSLVITTGSMLDNLANLSPVFIETVTGLYGGTRLAAQEIEGLLLSSVEGALWQPEDIDHVDRHPTLSKVVVAVDPSGSRGGAECGIIVVGAAQRVGEGGGRLRHGYVLDDLSLRGRTEDWANAAVAAVKEYRAHGVVGEVNYGGDMVRAAIHAVDPSIPFFAVRASRGKKQRAEPVALLYQKDRVHHVGQFGLLESQMLTWVDEPGAPSPDRLDALVWGVSHLLPQLSTPPARSKSAAGQQLPTGVGAARRGTNSGVAGMRLGPRFGP